MLNAYFVPVYVDGTYLQANADKVADELLKYRDTVGDFGTLLYAGKDWKDRDLGRRDARTEALQWTLERGSRSGRVARQFARDWAARHV